jgi:hypothetical protein
LPELPNLTASAALVDDHCCSYSTIGSCNADEIVNRALVIEIPSRLQDEAKPPCKVASAFRIEDQQAWYESGRCSITRFSRPRNGDSPGLRELLYEL